MIQIAVDDDIAELIYFEDTQHHFRQTELHNASDKIL